MVYQITQDIQEQLEQIQLEYEELSKKISNSDFLSQQHINISQINSRIMQLKPVYNNFEKYIELKDKLKQAEEIQEKEEDTELIELAEEESSDIQLQLEEIIKEIIENLRQSDPNDARNAILEIRAGTGGEEAALFAQSIYRMYAKYAENKEWKITQLSSNRTANGGFKEIISQISGPSVFGQLRYENGVHRVQRIPATESAGRIHTSTISIVVLPEVDDVSIEIKDEDIKIDVYRASGPGGQCVNTTDSAVRITHIPSGIVTTCQDCKSQHKNKEKALTILKSRLYKIEQDKFDQTQKNARNKAIKGGDRSAKIRTYNFPQNRVTDHRIKKSWYNIGEILEGNLEEIISTTKKLLLE
jgi:peptide chain release factor 1